MFKWTCSASVLALSTAIGAAPVAAQEPAPADEAPARDRIEQIVVTATKREESSQDVPVAVTAVSGETLDDLNIGNFDDYLRYLPNVTAGGRGPGQSTIYIRGLATDTIPVQLAGANGQSPNVALYLDEQPVNLVGRNLDVYAVDLERVEVLPGPQATLFGANSQAGTVRLITRKPVMNEFQAGAEGTVAFTQDGEMSTGVEGYFNIPILEDRLAARVAFFSVNEGGYIDNVFGSRTLPEENPAFPVGAELDAAVNTGLVEDDFNDSTYNGFRISATYIINDDWDLRVQHMRQELVADGVFDFDPEVGDLEVQRFFPDELDEAWHNTAWTLTGRLAMLDVLYTGAYLDREVNQTIDYTGYANVGGFIPYYICEYPSYASCADPTLGFRGEIENQRFTHEVRVNTPSTWRVRATVGAFYDDQDIVERGDFIYLGTIEQGFAPNAPIPEASNSDPSTRPPGVAFFNDITRTEQQIAIFGEVSFDVIPDLLTVTGGFRYFDLEVDVRGSANFAQRGVDGDSGVNLDAVLADFAPLVEEDVVFKANVSLTPTDNTLFYFTYSEGFRPGGFNRGGGQSNNPELGVVPFTFETDTLTNYEVGWKTSLFDGTLQFNGAAFFIQWEEIQTSVFNQEIFFLTFNDNAADAEIFGVEGDFIWAPTDNLVINGAFSILDTELTRVPESVVNVAPVGSELALAPSFQGNIRARYTWFLDDYEPYAQAALVYSADSFSSIVVDPNNRFLQDSYVTLDAAFGVQTGNWRGELFFENLTDERAELFINTQDNIRRITTNRPRTIGFRLNYTY
ncbi:MAG: TonB-dependent receptor [Alphaproteobacteria bacterium]